MATSILMPPATLVVGDNISPSVAWVNDPATFTLIAATAWILGTAFVTLTVESSVDNGVTWRQIGSVTFHEGTAFESGLPQITVPRASALYVPQPGAFGPPVFLPASTAVLARVHVIVENPLDLGLLASV